MGDFPVKVRVPYLDLDLLTVSRAPRLATSRPADVRQNYLPTYSTPRSVGK